MEENDEVNKHFRSKSTKYKVKDNSKPYFITTTIVGWVDTLINSVQVLLLRLRVGGIHPPRIMQNLRIIYWMI